MKEKDLSWNSNKGIEELIGEFLASHQGTPGTKRTYKNNLSLFVTWITQNVDDVHSIQKPDIVNYMQYLRDNGKTEYTVFAYIVSVKQFFKYLEEMNIYPNVTISIHASVKNKLFRKKTLSKEQITQLLSVIPRDTVIRKRDFAILNLISRMALRCCEVCRLNIEDLYQEEGRWLLKIQRKGTKEKLDIQGISDKVREPIEEYWRAMDRDISEPAFINHAYNREKIGPLKLFTVKKNDPLRMDPKTINLFFKKYLRMIGIDDPLITVHSLRHSVATIALMQNVGIYDIKALMAHEKMDSTLLYTASAEAEIKKRAIALSVIDKTF